MHAGSCVGMHSDLQLALCLMLERPAVERSGSCRVTEAQGGASFVSKRSGVILEAVALLLMLLMQPLRSLPCCIAGKQCSCCKALATDAHSSWHSGEAENANYR